MRKDIYTICQVACKADAPNAMQVVTSALVQDVSNSQFSPYIEAYVGSPCFVTDGISLIAMQAILLNKEYVDSLPAPLPATPVTPPVKVPTKLLNIVKKTDPE